MQKIVLTGPESTGKTTLAKQLASYFQTPWCPEYAREYIDQLNRPYQEEDLLLIAQEQEKRINERCTSDHSFIFCDTNLLTIKIWANYKYQRCDPWILQQLALNSPSFYFLCGIDTPWEWDPQRENPADRSELYHLYHQELTAYNFPFAELKGNEKERFEQAITQIRSLK